VNYAIFVYLLSYLSSVEPKGGGGNFFLALVPTGGFIIAAGMGGGTG